MPPGRPPKNPEAEVTPATVEIPADKLQQIQDLIDAQSKKMDEQATQIELLTKAANQPKLEKLKPKGAIGKAVKVSTFVKEPGGQPLIVTYWDDLIANLVIPKGGDIFEDQRMRLHLEDDSFVDIKINEFHDRTQQIMVECDLDKSKFEYDPKTGARQALLVANFDHNGKEYNIPTKFVNR